MSAPSGTRKTWVWSFGLRPRSLQEFVGQDELKGTLGITITTARGRDQALDHILLHGNPGLGKTTLAHIIARDGGWLAHHLRPGEQGPGRTWLQPSPTKDPRGPLASIDEIHRLPHVVEESSTAGVEDLKLDRSSGRRLDPGRCTRTCPVSPGW